MTWALILGGSSGLGLASARKLAADGYDLCVVYRESRSQEALVRRAMSELETLAPRLLHFNADALTEAGRTLVLGALADALRADERVGVLLHSIAKGALKPLCSPQASSQQTRVEAPRVEAPRVEVPPSSRAPDDAREATPSEGATLPRPTLQSRDVLLTVEAMGTSLLDWVHEIRTRQLFAPDARVLAFTSEGSHRVWPSYGAVSAAKATLESLVRAIAFELGPSGIRANCIQAGITDTRALQLVPGSEHLKAHALARNPLGRLTTPEDVANAVSLMCRPEAAWINGATLVVDGGEHLC
jgi:enoyl-[acyl-carrier protein] reductase III